MAKKQRKERNRTQHTELYKRRGIDPRLGEHPETIREKDGKKQKQKGHENEKREKKSERLKKATSTTLEKEAAKNKRRLHIKGRNNVESINKKRCRKRG